MAAFPAELSDEYPRAVRIARHAGPPDQAEDVAAEAFARVVAAIQGGRPVEQPVPYYRAAVRNGIRDARRGRHRTLLLEPAESYGPAPAADEAVLAAEEAARVRAAFDALPERYREVLWATEVEGRRPADLTAEFALSANGVAALAYRAREALRLAWLSAHATEVPDGCRQWAAMLGASCRGRLPRKHKATLDAHLGRCPGCKQLAAELMSVNSRLRGVLAPAALFSLRRLIHGLHPGVIALAAAGATALVLTTVPYTISQRPTSPPPAAVTALPVTAPGGAPPPASATAGARPSDPRHSRAALVAAASAGPGACATPRATASPVPSPSARPSPSASPSPVPSPSVTPTSTPSQADPGLSGATVATGATGATGATP
jgi:RNA polymerase sigma factor (sigma-70 family)